MKSGAKPETRAQKIKNKRRRQKAEASKAVTAGEQADAAGHETDKRELADWTINGLAWKDGTPLRANPPRDGIELWRIKVGAHGSCHRDRACQAMMFFQGLAHTITLVLLTLQGFGGWHHPIHVHLVDFLMVHGKGRQGSEFSDWDILTQVSF